MVVNCTGPFSDKIRQISSNVNSKMAAGKGSHFILPKHYINTDIGLFIPKTKNGRVLFLLPWQGHTLIGTTDI